MDVPFHDKVGVVLELLTLVVVIVYSIFAGLQWHEMKTTGADTHALASAAGKQAEAIVKLANATDQIARSTRRAIVSASLLNSNPVAPGSGFAPGSPRLTARLQIQNTGPTPATILSCRALAEAVRASAPPHFGAGESIPIHSLLGYGSAITRIDFMKFQGSTIGAVSPQLVNAMASGQTRLVVHGEIEYTDVYGDCRLSTFCSEYKYRPLVTPNPPNGFHV